MKELTPLLEELAKKLGTTVEQLWGVLLNQVQVEIQICEIWMGVALFFFGGFALVFFVLFIIGLIMVFDDGLGACLSMAGIFGVIGAFMYYKNYVSLLTLNNNPEYWALQEILKHL